MSVEMENNLLGRRGHVQDWQGLFHVLGDKEFDGMLTRSAIIHRLWAYS
jgi:hypothetical protein